MSSTLLIFWNDTRPVFGFTERARVGMFFLLQTPDLENLARMRAKTVVLWDSSERRFLYLYRDVFLRGRLLLNSWRSTKKPGWPSTSLASRRDQRLLKPRSC